MAGAARPGAVTRGGVCRAGGIPPRVVPAQTVCDIYRTKEGTGDWTPRVSLLWHASCLSGLTCTYSSPRSRKVSSCHAPLRWGVHTGHIVRGQPSKDARPTASGARVSTNIVWRLLRQGPCHGYWICNRLPSKRLLGPGPRVSAHLLLAHDVGRASRCMGNTLHGHNVARGTHFPSKCSLVACPQRCARATALDSPLWSRAGQ